MPAVTRLVDTLMVFPAAWHVLWQQHGSTVHVLLYCCQLAVCFKWLLGLFLGPSIALPKQRRCAYTAPGVCGSCALCRFKGETVRAE